MPAYSPDQIAAYQKYLQTFQASQQAKQQAGPQPFQPAENMDKQKLSTQQITPDMSSRAPSENKSAIRQAADTISAGVGGLVKGATFGLSGDGGQYPGMGDAMADHPHATQYGELAGGAAAGAGIGKLVGAAGGVGQMALKALASKIPGIGALISKGLPEASAAASGAGEAVSQVGESEIGSEAATAGSQAAPAGVPVNPTSPSLKDIFKIRGAQ